MPPTHVSSSVPLTQNTAPILEFRCLFTPDLKKKQKKWQDGRLKFHTFNKRIMVYDDRTNYVGDTHYHTYTLEEGEEVELERGVLVEVGELIGKQDQDLGEVLDAVRGAGKSARQASIAPERGAGRGATPGPSAARYATPAPAARQMPMISTGPVRPLSALLGTPQGHYGRALVPTTSPFEDRQNAMRVASETPEPASKRRKVDSMSAAQPLWARTSLMPSGSKNVDLQAKPVARELSYPDSIAPKARVKKTFAKPAKPGYAQKLTGAALDLSSTQKTNAYMGRPASARQESPYVESDEEVAITGERPKPSAPAPILPPVKRKPAAILPPKKPTEIVYPDSIAPKRKERKTFEKSSKAGYAEKLTGAALDLSGSNMANVYKRRQPSIRLPSANDESDDDEMGISDVHERPRVETPILPPAPTRKPAPILPPKTALKEIVYPDSIAPKAKARKTFKKKLKAGFAERLTGAALNLSGAPAASMKRSQPSKEEEALLARLAELRSQREAQEQAEVELEVEEVVAPKPKKARISKKKATLSEVSPMSDKENQESFFVEDDFVDIDAITSPPPDEKAVKPKKPRAPRRKKQPEVTVPNDADDLFDSAMEYVANHGVRESPPAMQSSNSKETSIPIRNAPQDKVAANTPQGGGIDQIRIAQSSRETSQASASGNNGSLRIKTKPKRKMLMMQSLPPRQVAAPAPPSPAVRPAILPGVVLPQKHAPPEPSQATKTLTEFHDKQKEKLEERRKKIEARKRIPIQILSSPEPEPGFDSSPPPARGRELSAADEERLANGHSVLIKIKSGIRSKEIIRPKSVNQMRTGDDNPFIGFARPPQPVIRSRTGSFVAIEAEEGPESEDGADEDEVMRDLEMQAEEERRVKLRREEAQRKTREFREKKERERVVMEEMRRAEEERLADKLRAEEEERNMLEKRKIEEQERQARELRWQQGKERLAKEEMERADAERQDKLREEEEEREREEKRRLEQQLKKEAEEKAHQERRKVEAQQKAELETKRKLEEQVRYDEMKQRIENEMQEKMDAQLKAMQEKLRLSNQRFAEQQERERLEKESHKKAELQRIEDLRVKEQTEARQREVDAVKLEELRLADQREKETRDAELKRKQAAEDLRQQMAVEAAAAKLASSASSLPRSLPKASSGLRADEAQAEKEKMSKQTEYQKRVNRSFGKSFGTSNDANTSIEHIDISDGGSFSEGDFVLAQPKVTAFKIPAPRSQAAMQPQTPKTVVARLMQSFPTHLHAAMYANGITTSTNDFAATFQSTPPAVGYKVPSTLHLSAPSFKPFCKPKSVPIVPKKAPKTMKEIRDEKNAERENREDLKRIPGWDHKGNVLEWETGAWTAEAGDLFGWRPKVGDFEEE